MTLKKIFGLLSFVVLIVHPVLSQTDFQKSITDNLQLDHKYTSMVRIEDATGKLTGYLVAGTRFNNPPATNKSDYVVFTFDPNGNLIKDFVIDNFRNEVCLDVVMGFDNSAVITGYVELPNGKRHALITELDPTTGVVIFSKAVRLMDGTSSIGTTITYDKINNQYVLGGMSIADPSDISSGATGFIMKMRSNFSKLWIKRYVGNFNSGLTAPNEIVITPNSDVFVTGTFMVGPSVQGMAAFMLNKNGSLKWDLSHNSSNHLHMGVDALYENDNNGTIYLASNNSQDHNFQITIIKNVNAPSAFISTEYMINVYSSYSGGDPISLGIEPTANGELAVMGMFSNANYVNSSENAPLFITEFEKSNGSIINTRLYQIASQNYNATHSLLLSPFWTAQANCMYSPSSFVKDDNDGYTFVGNRLLASNTWNSELLNAKSNLTISNECNFAIYPSLITPSHSRNHYSMKFDVINMNMFPLNKKLKNVGIKLKALCPLAGEKSNSPMDKKKLNMQELSIYPNPSEKGSFTIQLNGFSENKNILIYNSFGTKVFEEYTKQNTSRIEIFNLNKGVYFVQVNDGINQKVEKLIIN